MNTLAVVLVPLYQTLVKILRFHQTLGFLSLSGKWCPEEDSNLHDLAIAST